MAENDIKLVDADVDALVKKFTNRFFELSKKKLAPASPEMFYVLWGAWVVAHERALINWSAKQNLPRYASGAYQDALADLFFNMPRLSTRAAGTTMSFSLSMAQGIPSVIPAGTRVSPNGVLQFRSGEDCVILPGALSATVAATCLTLGTAGNGFAPGSIAQTIDYPPFAYYAGCVNVAESSGGADREGDRAFYERMRLSRDAYAVAGPSGAYEYIARSVDPAIVDARAVTPEPGRVNVYIKTHGTTLPPQKLIADVRAALSPVRARPLTDFVDVLPPDQVDYDIDFTYYLYEGGTDADAAEAAVRAKVSEYIEWQGGRIGRDINTSKLTTLLMEAGVKRVEIRQPVYREVRGSDPGDAAVEVAVLNSLNIANGGFEHE
jgi:phage-related baseplate assembly protein